MAPPFLFSPLFQAALSNVILIGSFLVWKMAQLHRLYDTIADHRGTEAGSQSEEQHLATLVTSQGLHGCIVDHLDGVLKGGFKLEANPPFREVVRFGERPIAEHGTRVAHRHHVVLP